MTTSRLIGERQLYYGDNLKIMREYIASESVDLVYLVLGQISFELRDSGERRGISAFEVFFMRDVFYLCNSP